MGQAWISASWALWLAAVVLLLAVVVPAQTAAGAAIADGPRRRAYAGRISARAASRRWRSRRSSC
jgi:hypothetical protein